MPAGLPQGADSMLSMKTCDLDELIKDYLLLNSPSRVDSGLQAGQRCPSSLKRSTILSELHVAQRATGVFESTIVCAPHSRHRRGESFPTQRSTFGSGLIGVLLISAPVKVMRIASMKTRHF
jgi:hypothetical protein